MTDCRIRGGDGQGGDTGSVRLPRAFVALARTLGELVDDQTDEGGGAFRADAASGPVDVNGPVGIADDASGELSALMKEISREVSGQIATLTAGISAMYAARIQAAVRGAPRHLVAGIVAALRAEMQAAITAAAEKAGKELVGRLAGVVMEYRGKGRTPRKMSKKQPDVG